MFTLPAGKYVIGDPCYTVPDDQWSDLLDQNDCFGTPEGTFKNPVTGEEIQVIAFSTMYGDGTYPDGQGREYGVDAGLIGIIPLVEGLEVDRDIVHVVEFKHEFTCSEHQGVLEFGHVIINTAGEEDGDDVDYSDDGDDE